MSSEVYEIEVKSLLGDAERAAWFRDELKKAYPTCEVASTESQLNHYFEGGDIATLAERLAPHLSQADREKFNRIVDRATSASVRTREANGEVRFVVKASLGDDSSDNGVVRAEFDAPIPNLSLAALDEEILAAGYRYQAKWSRDREVYELPEVTVCLDRNAGYGYLVEFEKVIEDPTQAEHARAQIDTLMGGLGVEELPQDRLERMFAHYNKHWSDYYGTDKVFVIT